MKKVYICSPCRGDYENNIQRAKEFSRAAVERGCIPVTPHIYLTQFMDDTVPAERELGLSIGRELVLMCDELWAFGLDCPTAGMAAEIELARERGIPVLNGFKAISEIPEAEKRDEDPQDAGSVIIRVPAFRAMARCNEHLNHGPISIEVDGRIIIDLAKRLKENPDTGVAILDIMLPDIDGFEVCRRIRATGSKMGILMLSAKSQEMDKITGLMTGADDYVTKPFSPAELLARVDALYRRIGGSENTEDVLSSGPFVLHLRSRTLDKNSEHIRLTQTEFAIMKLFMENPGRALSREDILHAVWGADYNGEVKIVDVNIRRLRIKIEDDATEPEYITTVWGYGYKWGY